MCECGRRERGKTVYRTVKSGNIIDLLLDLKTIKPQ